MHQDIMQAGVEAASGLLFKSKSFRTLKAMLVILLITVLGAGMIGIIFFVGMMVLTR